jgi:hypothetical protein
MKKRLYILLLINVSTGKKFSQVSRMAGISEIQESCMKTEDNQGIPAPRIHEAEQLVLETASGILTSSPATCYLMSFIVRMRYSPETDSCQVVIQTHYSPTEWNDNATEDEVVSPLSDEIRAAVGERITAKACRYISASSTLDEDNLTDLFILYLFMTGTNENDRMGVSVSGVYQLNLTLRTFVPEMEEIAVDALTRCLSLIRQGPGFS